MEEFLLQAPIPGQSLTDEPKNFPWENPADISEPNEALMYHIERINKPAVLEDIYSLIELGFPLYSLSESMLSVAVMEGIHSVDMSLSLAPLIYQQLVQIAEEADLTYKTGLEEDDVIKTEKQKEKLEALIRKEINSMPDDDEDEEGLLGDILDSLNDSQPNYDNLDFIDKMKDKKEDIVPSTPTSPPKPFGQDMTPEKEFKRGEEPRYEGPINPDELGTDSNPIMAGKGLMSRGVV